MPKIQLAAQGGDHDPRTDHLRPVIEFLLAQGNTPTGWRGDTFSFDQGGEGHYTFTGPLDAAQLREHFTFPASIRVDDDGTIRDSFNRVDISHERPPLLFSFELAPDIAPLAVDTLPSTAPPAVDNEAANEKLTQIIAARNARRDAGLA